MDMELRHYSYFVALAEELHFAKAAERCGISQPALSQQIRAIETRLGASLMSRSKRHLELTEVGKVFYTQAQAVLRQAEAAQHAIAEAAQGRAGRVAIAYVASAALSCVLLGIVYEYSQSRPDIFFFFSSRRRHTRCLSDWSSDVCSSDLGQLHSSRFSNHTCVREPFIAT